MDDDDDELAIHSVLGTTVAPIAHAAPACDVRDSSIDIINLCGWVGG